MAGRLEDVVLRDTRANQPAATAVPAGTQYFVTDEEVTERSNGTAWESYSGDVVGSLAALVLDDLADVDAGSPTDGDVLTYDDGSGDWVAAAPAGSSSSAPVCIAKTATETVNNSTTFQNDDHLLFSVDANSIYLFELWLLAHGNSTSTGFKFQWTLPAGAAIRWAPVVNIQATSHFGPFWMNQATGTAAPVLLGTSSFSVASNNNTGTMGIHFIGVMIIAGTAGTAQLQWAQDSAGMSDNVLEIGSTLRYQKANV